MKLVSKDERKMRTTRAISTYGGVPALKRTVVSPPPTVVVPPPSKASMHEPAPAGDTPEVARPSLILVSSGRCSVRPTVGSANATHDETPSCTARPRLRRVCAGASDRRAGDFARTRVAQACQARHRAQVLGPQTLGLSGEVETRPLMVVSWERAT